MESGGTEPFDFWGVFGPWIQNGIFFVLGIVVTLVIEARRSIRGEREIWVSTSLASLAKTHLGVSRNALEYRVDGVTISEPHQLHLSIWANGSKDIPVEAFAGRTAHIGLGVPVRAIIGFDSADSKETALSLDEATGDISIDPSVVRRGMAASWVLITDGVPKLSFSSKPLDTEFYHWQTEYDAPRRSKTLWKIGAIASFVAAAVFFVCAILFGRSFIDDAETMASAVGMITGLLLTAGLTLSMFGGLSMGARLRAARRALRSRGINAFPKDVPNEEEPITLDD